MAITSFRDVIKDMYNDDIFDVLSEYVESNPGRLDVNSYTVESPDEVSLDDVRIISINITDSEGNGILFDVVVAAEIEVAETVRRNRETDGVEQRFRISCSADLDDGLQSFDITGIHIYYKYRDSKETHLSEYLVPIISKDKFDDAAEKFLKKYYPEALTKPMAVPAREIAKRMDLNIRKVHITETCSVFGWTYFSG